LGYPHQLYRLSIFLMGAEHTYQKVCEKYKK
jgi:hypothetical protein